MSDPYAETGEWPTPSLPARPATRGPERPEDGSTVTGDTEGAREARYAEAISRADDEAPTRTNFRQLGADYAEQARAVMAVADEEQAALRVEVVAAEAVRRHVVRELKRHSDAIREALRVAEQIEPNGSPEWVASGRAMRTTVLREIRAILSRIGVVQ